MIDFLLAYIKEWWEDGFWLEEQTDSSIKAAAAAAAAAASHPFHCQFVGEVKMDCGFSCF